MINSSLLKKAVSQGILTQEQAENLTAFIASQSESSPSFNLTNVLYYFGGLIAITAMSLFMTLGWEAFGGWGIMAIALIYAVIGLLLTHYLDNKHYKIPAGICATFVIALTPLAIYGFQQGIGFWPDQSTYQDYYSVVKWNWIYMELGTLLIGVILAWIYRYPFMVMPIAFTLWFLSMDFTQMFTGGQIDFQLSAKLSMYFGLVTILIAFWVDLRSKDSADYAFWLYIFGVITFWSSMSALDSNSELSRFIYLCINLFMIWIGVILVRKVFVIFGALGCCFYLGHLAWVVFKDSLLFPFALTLIGFIIVYLGILWQRHEKAINQRLLLILPQTLGQFILRNQ